MKPINLSNLKPGNRVYWHDPDNNRCSREYVIAAVEYRGDGMYLITEANGAALECYKDELSLVERK